MSSNPYQLVRENWHQVKLIACAATIGGVVFWIGGYCEVFLQSGSSPYLDDETKYERASDSYEQLSEKAVMAEVLRREANPWGLWWAVLGVCAGALAAFAIVLNPFVSRTADLRVVIVVGMILAALSSLAVYVAFGPSVFSEWPWIRTSILISTITCLVPFAGLWNVNSVYEDSSIETWLYSIVFVPILAILIQPRAPTLELLSGKYIFLHMIALQIVHGIGFSIVKQLLLQQVQRDATLKRSAQQRGE